ncbi:zinc finger, CCHC-type containing protein [Tanacetum coccineum]
MDRYCDYHGAKGHLTNDCHHLKEQLKTALETGKLDHLLRDVKERGRVPPKGGHAGKGKIINVSFQCDHGGEFENHALHYLPLKYLANSTLSRYKAFLVANGSTQLEVVDVDETFSPVVKPVNVMKSFASLSNLWEEFVISSSFVKLDNFPFVSLRSKIDVDGGGSYYMTHRWDFSYDFKGFDGGSVQLGDNRTCTIKGTGKVKIQLHDGSSFILKDVKYVPRLRRSLISLGTLEKEGYTVKMQMGRIKVIKGCRVMMTGMRKKNCVYTLEAKVMTFGVQKHGGPKQVGFKQLGHKQVGFKQLGPSVETRVHGVSKDDAAVAQRRLGDKQHEKKYKHGLLGKGAGKGGPRFEVPARGKDVEYRLCLSVTPKVEIVGY